jgi:hypothetical protein
MRGDRGGGVAGPLPMSTAVHNAHVAGSLKVFLEGSGILNR